MAQGRKTSVAQERKRTSAPTRDIPQRGRTLTPDLAITGAAKAIEFYKQVFGAHEVSRSVGPDGTMIMHAQLEIGDSPLFLADVFPPMEEQRGQRDQLAVGSAGGPEHSRVVLNLYVEDADAVFDRAVKAGAEVVMPIADMFWGDRYGQVRDPYGHIWAIATHKEDLTPEEIAKRSAEFFANMPR
ncbi:MAG TPA: VOC family protein [bacterium]